MARKSHDYKFLTLLVGDDHDTIGKLVFKVSDGPYIYLIEKRIEIDGKIIQLNIGDLRDTAYWSCYPSYLTIKGMLLTYDITRHESFEYVSSVWRQFITKVAKSDTEVMLIGFNCHLEYQRMVPTETAARYADELGMKFMEVSTVEDLNIDEVIFTLASGILRRIKKREKVSRFWFIIGRFIQIHPIFTKGKICFKAVLLNTV
ncbi:ras-related protein Rab-10-like [Pocillopora verrucosa]|uniref:ras-related protein Rab-10-like n=1 Tax=Pocillopora verrucosa TaxID=203993 RepID=UPI0033406268